MSTNNFSDGVAPGSLNEMEQNGTLWNIMERSGGGVVHCGFPSCRVRLLLDHGQSVLDEVAEVFAAADDQIDLLEEIVG